MDDLLGLGKGSEKLISAVERSIGAFYHPYGKRREADAEAYRIKVVEGAKTDAKVHQTVALAKAKSEAAAILSEEKQALESRLRARLQHEAIKEQHNIEQVVAAAAAETAPANNDEEVDSDWMTTFFSYVKNVSRPEMQALWGKVLALEVGVPGQFSIRALETLSRMSRAEAEAFQSVCRLAVSSGVGRPKLNIPTGAVRDSWFMLSVDTEVELNKFKAPFMIRKNLAAIGLLYDEAMVQGPFQKGEERNLIFSSTCLKLRAKKRGAQISSYGFTPVGRELSLLLSADECDDFITDIAQALSKYFHVTRASI